MSWPKRLKKQLSRFSMPWRASVSPRPSAVSSRMPCGSSVMPTPSSFTSGAPSYTRQGMPRWCRASASVSPPMPPPTIAMSICPIPARWSEDCSACAEPAITPPRPAGSELLQLLQGAHRLGGVRRRVEGDVGDKGLADGSGGQAAHVEAGLGERRPDPSPLARLVRALNAHGVQGRALGEARLLGRPLGGARDWRHEYHARPWPVRSPAGNDELQIGLAVGERAQLRGEPAGPV